MLNIIKIIHLTLAMCMCAIHSTEINGPDNMATEIQARSIKATADRAAYVKGEVTLNALSGGNPVTVEVPNCHKPKEKYKFLCNKVADALSVDPHTVSIVINYSNTTGPEYDSANYLLTPILESTTSYLRYYKNNPDGSMRIIVKYKKLNLILRVPPLSPGEAIYKRVDRLNLKELIEMTDQHLAVAHEDEWKNPIGYLKSVDDVAKVCEFSYINGLNMTPEQLREFLVENKILLEEDGEDIE